MVSAALCGVETLVADPQLSHAGGVSPPPATPDGQLTGLGGGGQRRHQAQEAGCGQPANTADELAEEEPRAGACVRFETRRIEEWIKGRSCYSHDECSSIPGPGTARYRRQTTLAVAL